MTVTALNDQPRRWLTELYESNFSAVFNACRSVLKSPEDAADAAHEVFLRSVDALEVEASAPMRRAWQLTVASNHCLDVARRRKRLSGALTRLAADSSTASEPERTVVDRDLVRGGLEPLRSRERQALWQSAVEQRPLAEIATYLGLNYMAAAQFVHRARRHACLVAARLAAIFGFDRMRQPRLNVSRALPAVLAATVMPILVATAIPSSSAKDRFGSMPRSAPVTVAVSPARASIANDVSITGSSTGSSNSPGWVKASLQLPPILTGQPGGTVINSTLSRVERTMPQLLPSLPPLPKPGVPAVRPPSGLAADA
jgi:RNA polymerase sigma factor (sigma-70 family)